MGLVGEPLEMIDPLPESIEEGADLQTGQRGAEAEVGTETERDVMVRRAGEVEGLGVVEMGRIPIRGAVGQQHLLALADGAAVEFDILGGGTAEVVDRGDPADELFGGDLDVGPVLEELPLVRSVGEFEQGTSDDGAGGFGAAVEQLLKQPAPQNEKLPTKEELASVNSEFSGQRNEIRQEPPTQLEVARLVAAIKRASE